MEVGWEYFFGVYDHAQQKRQNLTHLTKRLWSQRCLRSRSKNPINRYLFIYFDTTQFIYVKIKSNIRITLDILIILFFHKILPTTFSTQFICFDLSLNLPTIIYFSHEFFEGLKSLKKVKIHLDKLLA